MIEIVDSRSMRSSLIGGCQYPSFQEWFRAHSGVLNLATVQNEVENISQFHSSDDPSTTVIYRSYIFVFSPARIKEFFCQSFLTPEDYMEEVSATRWWFKINDFVYLVDVLVAWKTNNKQTSMKSIANLQQYDTTWKRKRKHVEKMKTRRATLSKGHLPKIIPHRQSISRHFSFLLSSWAADFIF